MSLFRVNTFEVEPGRVQDFFESQRRVAGVQESIGGFLSRRVLKRASGDNPAGIYSVVFEFDDWAAFGSFLAGVAASEELQGTGPGVAADSGWSLVSSQFATEVEL